MIEHHHLLSVLKVIMLKYWRSASSSLVFECLSLTLLGKTTPIKKHLIRKYQSDFNESRPALQTNG